MPVRSAPTRNVTGPRRSTSASGAPRSAVSPTRRPAGAAASSGTEKIAPIDARTAFGLVGSAHSSSRYTEPGPNAAIDRSSVPTLPGSRTPCSSRVRSPTASRGRSAVRKNASTRAG